MNKRKTKLLIIFVALCLSFPILTLTGCGTDDIDVSAYEDREIILSGLEEMDIILTIGDLKSMDCQTIKTHSTSDKIGDVRATGPWLDTVISEYGYSQEDFKKIIFYGEDGYDVRLGSDYIKEHDIMLAFGIDGEPLDEESVPCRVIIKESDSAYWIRMVNRIEFK